MGQPTPQLCGSVWEEDSERKLCRCLASGGLPGTRPPSSYSTQSLRVTGTLPAVALGLNPRAGGCAYVLRLCGPFKWSFLKILQFLLPSQQPPWFLQPEVMEIYLSGLYSLAWGWDHLLPRYPSQFLSTTHECGIAHAHSTTAAASLPCLCLSFLPTHLDDCGFFKSLVLGLLHSSIFWQAWVLFWDLAVILFVVVPGDAVCLPIPPPWLEVPENYCKKTNERALSV